MESWEKRKRVWDLIYNKPGQSSVEIKEQSGLSQDELLSVFNQLEKIDFIKDKEGKIFPTKYAAMIMQGLMEIQNTQKIVRASGE